MAEDRPVVVMTGQSPTRSVRSLHHEPAAPIAGPLMPHNEECDGHSIPTLPPSAANQS